MARLREFKKRFLFYLKKQNSNEQGFTIVEVLVVIALIVILSSIAIPSYTYYKTKARKGVVKTLLISAYRTMDIFKATDETPTAEELTKALKSKTFSQNGDLKLKFSYNKNSTSWCIGVEVKKTGEYGPKGKNLGCVRSYELEIYPLFEFCATEGRLKGDCVPADLFTLSGEEKD